MRHRWLGYALLGLGFGLADWYFLDLLATLSQNQALSQGLDQANALVRLVVVLALIAANYGIWLVPVVPAAIHAMKRSGSIRRAALAASVVWSAAMVSYYVYYAFMLMWVGQPNMDFMLFANRHLPGYWADWWPPFRRVIVDQFVEWIGIAVVGGAIVGALTALVYRWVSKRRTMVGAALILFIVFGLSACAPTPAAPLVQVTVEVLPPMTATPPPACTPLLPGMAWTLTTQPNAVMIELTGLLPGEQPAIVLYHDVPGEGGRRIESSTEPVGGDGRLVHKEFGLVRIAEETANDWHIQVIHAGGVACTDVILP